MTDKPSPLRNYTHPETITGLRCRALSRLCIRQRIAMAMRPAVEGDNRWFVMCAEPDLPTFLKLLTEAEAHDH